MSLVAFGQIGGHAVFFICCFRLRKSDVTFQFSVKGEVGTGNDEFSTFPLAKTEKVRVT